MKRHLRQAAAVAALLPTVYLPSRAAAQVAQAGAAKPGSHAHGSAAVAKSRTVTVVARDFAFEAPSSIAAGTVTFRLLNRGKELHHISLVKLLEGHTAADLAKLDGPPPSWIVAVGGPNAPAPGGDSQASVTLEPGNYALLCFIPSPDGTPHVMKGMMHPLTVTPGNSGAEPKADVVVKLVDYAFDVSGPLTPGQHTILFENAGEQPHEAFIAMLAPGKSASDLLTWLDQGQKGPPPAMPMGGVTGIEKGGRNWTSANFKPGRYALICFVSDAKDGKPHFAHGMVKEIEVRSRGTVVGRDGL